jgi:hypothetical protein
MIRIPCGSRPTLRFAFPARELTEQELARFLAGEGLPNGVGVDPNIVFLEYQQPNDSKGKRKEGEEVVRDGSGEYHVVMPVGMDAAGVWQWRGRGEDEDGSPFACTPPQSFDAYRTF